MLELSDEISLPTRIHAREVEETCALQDKKRGTRKIEIEVGLLGERAKKRKWIHGKRP